MLLSDLVDLIKKGNSNFISANIFEDLIIDDAASLDAAVKHQISFLEENNILKEKLDQTKASVIITSNNDEIVSVLKKLNISNIIVKNPRIAFAEVLDSLYKQSNTSANAILGFLTIMFDILSFFRALTISSLLVVIIADALV